MTLRENNLKELEGGHILWSQGALVANRRALQERPGLLEVVHELIERFEAHLKAGKFYSVLANMRGTSAEEVRKEHKRKDKTTPFGVSLMRSQVLYQAAQG